MANLNKEINLFLHVPLQEKVLLTRHLAIAIKSGMTLLEGLRLIRDQSRSSSLKKIIDSVTEDINAGSFLWKALEKYSHVFGPLFINIIKIGETSGTLSENLEYLTKELKKKHDLRTKVRGALIYPAVVLTATVGIAVAMVVVIIPKLLPVFRSVRVELPVTTRILISVSSFLSERGVFLLILLVILTILFIALKRFRSFRHVVHHALLFVPVVRGMIVEINATSIARTLGLLLKSGVSVTDAVRITAETTDNLVYQHELQNSVLVIEKGEFFSSYLKKNKKLFPLIMTNMIEVGENTGNFVENLEYVAEYYEGRVDDFVGNLSSTLEPILMVVMGVMVGFIALSIITPIYSLTQGLQQ